MEQLILPEGTKEEWHLIWSLRMSSILSPLRQQKGIPGRGNSVCNGEEIRARLVPRAVLKGREKLGDRGLVHHTRKFGLSFASELCQDSSRSLSLGVDRIHLYLKVRTRKLSFLLSSLPCFRMFLFSDSKWSHFQVYSTPYLGPRTWIQLKLLKCSPIISTILSFTFHFYKKCLVYKNNIGLL